MSTGFCSPGTARPWRRWWRGLPATAIVVKTPTISTASGGCGRSTGGFAFSPSESKPRKWWTRKLRERGTDLKSSNHPDIYVTGDLAFAAHGNGEHSPGLPQVAMQGGQYSARAILRRVKVSRNSLPFGTSTKA